MLALFNTFDHATKELMRSLATAGITFTPVVIHYDGELPEGALCPFATYTGVGCKGDPLFFNEVPVPAWCEIRQGREVYGEILRDACVIGRINYAANSFRQVESVDWLLPDQKLGHTDHYDRYGNRYATTYYSDDVAYQTVYRGPREWEIGVNHVSRVVTMRSPHSLLTFETLTDFVSYFIDDQRLADDRVLINSLSHPLFVMRKRAAEPNTTLFWQEAMPGDVPGNMAMELGQPRALARIVFCDERLRQKVVTRYPHTALDLTYLSLLTRFADKHGYDLRRVFTLTNTDEIPGLAELLEAFPDVTFAVAAPTVMSEKLHGLGRRYPNLTLIPTISHRGIREELDKASVYLDINAGAHVLDVVKAAYYLNLVVLAVIPYAKAPDYSRTFATMEELKAYLSAVITSSQDRTRALDELHRQHGRLSTPADYRRLFTLATRWTGTSSWTRAAYGPRSSALPPRGYSERTVVTHYGHMNLQQSWYARDARDWTCESPGGAAAFHRGLPGYAPTPLTEAPALAAELGVGRLFIKDESARFDLRAFKFLGASWAGFLAVAGRTGYAGAAELAGLRSHIAAAGPGPVLVTATDGNHGRAVARIAGLLGLTARVYVPKVVPALVIDRIAGEGAQLTVIDADYDGTVAAARDDAAGDPDAILVQDTAWPGYEQVPGWIVDGYETLFAELDAQLAATGAGAPALVGVPAGVGSLAQAAVAHYRRSGLPAASRPRLLSVEPDTAACVLASLTAEAPVSVPTGGTVMNGLNCGTPSSLAWPYLLGGLDAATTVTDDQAQEAIASLAGAGVAAGPSGAAAFAGLRAALTGDGSAARRADLGLGAALGASPADMVAVCLCTEGPLTIEP